MSKNTLIELVHPSRLKILRAKAHIKDLGTSIDGFLAEKPFELYERLETNPLQKAFYVKQLKCIPDEIPLIIGDAIHNLKSALDILAYRMVCDKAPSPERVLFPFAKTPEGINGSIKNRQLHLAGNNVVEAIKSLHPYAGGNSLLYGLQTLDTQDKHHMIISTGQVSNITGDQMQLLGFYLISGPGTLVCNIPTGKTIMALIYDASRAVRRKIKFFDNRVEFQPSFQICFANGQGFDGAPIIPTLLSMVEITENAVDLIGKAYLE